MDPNFSTVLLDGRSHSVPLPIAAGSFRGMTSKPGASPTTSVLSSNACVQRSDTTASASLQKFANATICSVGQADPFIMPRSPQVGGEGEDSVARPAKVRRIRLACLRCQTRKIKASYTQLFIHHNSDLLPLFGFCPFSCWIFLHSPTISLCVECQKRSRSSGGTSPGRSY
jgi:hypothetical protein